MSFLILPLWAVTAGALALAGLLYGLQHLKTRPRVVRLPAARLWVEASREMPPKVLWERFHGWPAYLLVLAIALALWFAGARPEVAADRADQKRIFYLDASAAMMGGDAFSQAKRALISDVRATPDKHREVYLGDGAGTHLLSPGENVALLTQRLSGVAAVARPSEFEAWALAHVASAKQPTALRYYGGWPAAKSLAAVLPDGVLLSYGYLARATPENRGVVNLGVTPAASGDWTRADVQIEAVASDGRTIGAGDLSFSRGGAVFAPSVLPLGRGRFRLNGLEADGRLLTVALKTGDGFPADDTASVRLPDHRSIRIALSPSVPTIIRDLIRLDTAFQVVPADRAEIVIRREGETLGADKPAFVLAPQGERATFAFTRPEVEAPIHLASGLARLGLGEVDAGGLADRLAQPVSVDVAVGPRRLVSVWSSVFDQDANFAKSAGLPLFVSQSLRWLADRDPWVAYAQAGARLSDQSSLYGLGEDRRITARAMNGDVRMGAAGVENIDGLPLAVSLTDRRQTLAAAEAPPPDVVRKIGHRSPPDLVLLLLVLAAANLLVVEWWVFMRGAIA